MTMIEVSPVGAKRVTGRQSILSGLPTWTAAVSVILVTMSGMAWATPITNLGTGILNIGNGSVIVTGNGLTTGCIDFYNLVAPATCQIDGTTSMLTVEGGSTAPFASGQTGTITDLNFNTVFPVIDFIDIGPSGSVARFDLKDLRYNNGPEIGNCMSTAPGVTCTPANSPFQITNGLADANGVVNTVSITLTVDAWGYTGSSGTNHNSANPYVGIFTTQSPLQGNIVSILARITSGGRVDSSWSASFAPLPAVATPEPFTFGLFGGGLILAGILGRRFRKL